MPRFALTLCARCSIEETKEERKVDRDFDLFGIAYTRVIQALQYLILYLGTYFSATILWTAPDMFLVPWNIKASRVPNLASCIAKARPDRPCLDFIVIRDVSQVRFCLCQGQKAASEMSPRTVGHYSERARWTGVAGFAIPPTIDTV